ncbi:MAG: hypothetical protein MZV63_55770 [Marinilabiliales bacterium]|nr:hypothetical protein [Marinilabiliales bacterium]
MDMVAHDHDPFGRSGGIATDAGNHIVIDIIGKDGGLCGRVDLNAAIVQVDVICNDARLSEERYGESLFL